MLALVGGIVFAQDAPALKIEAAFDAIWIPFQYVSKSVPDGAKYKDISLMGAGLGRDSQSQGPRFSLFISGGNQYIGFQVNPVFLLNQNQHVSTANTGGTAPTADDHVFSGWRDDAHVWAKPFGDDMLKIYAGVYNDNTLRGKITDYWFKNFTTGNENGDQIFSRFRGQGYNTGAQSSANAGVLLISKPIPELYIGVNFPGLASFGADDPADTQLSEVVKYNNGLNEFSRVYKNTQIGVGYTIKDIGLARVQFLGGHPRLTSGVVDRSPRFEAAFAVDGPIPGLLLDIGGKVPLPVNGNSVVTWGGADDGWVNLNPGTVYDEWSKLDLQEKYTASIGFRYRMTVGDIKDDFEFMGRIDTKFGGYVKYDGDVVGETDKKTFELNAHIWPSYNLGFAIIGFDFGIYMNQVEKQDPRFGAGLWLQKNFGNSNNFIRGGLAYSHGSEGWPAAGGKNKTDMMFSIPIEFQSRF